MHCYIVGLYNIVRMAFIIIAMHVEQCRIPAYQPVRGMTVYGRVAC